MPKTVTPNALRGDALEELLERACSLLDEEDDFIPKAQRYTAVAELLRQHPLAPVNMRELRALHRLWMNLEHPEAAHDALRQHSNTVLRTHAGTALTAAKTELELLLLDSLWHLGQKEEGKQQLARLQQQMQANPQLKEALHSLWHAQAMAYEAWDLLEADVDWDYRPDNATKFHLPAVFAHMRKAQLAHHYQKDSQRAQRHINEGITALAEAAHGTDLDFAQRWEQFSSHVIEIAPSYMERFVQAARAHLHAIDDPPVPAAIRAHWEVLYARWRAQALARQENWQDALQWAERGHFRLESDPFRSDAFGALRLQWLLTTGHIEQAAELAWRGIWYVRNHIAQRAYGLALEQRNSDSSRPHWDWILAFVQIRTGFFKDDEYHPSWLQESEHPPLPPTAYLARAKTIAPNHPMHDLIEGIMLADDGQWSACLPLLERGVLALPAWADNHSVRLLWSARFQCLTERQALRRPFPQSHDAVWCLDTGIDLIEDSGFINTTCPTTSTTTRKHRCALGQRYYEQGLTRCEAFVASGQGAFMDADYDIYSRLCNNLAVQYRCTHKLAQQAIALHRTGIACLAHAQHHANLFWCAVDAKDWAMVMHAAESHWHALQNCNDLGSNPYNPLNYASDIADALHHANRHLEISIWLDRLNIWWQQQRGDNNEDEGTNTDLTRLHGDHLQALVILLEKYAIRCPQETSILLHQHLPDILACNNSHTLYMAGVTLARCGDDHEHILSLYRKALTTSPPPNRQTAATLSRAIKARRAIAKKQRIIALGRQWGAHWKHWFTQ